MSGFYEKVLGLKRGKRPAFGFGGAWHYCSGHAIVHLVELTDDIKPGQAQVEHFALRATGSLKSFQRKLRRHDAPYNVVTVEDLNMRQINVFDPDGNKIEVQFVASKDDDVETFWGSKGASARIRKGMKLNKTQAIRDRDSKSRTTRTNAKLGVPKPIRDVKRPRKRAA
jgi:hypothetical protein